MKKKKLIYMLNDSHSDNVSYRNFVNEMSKICVIDKSAEERLILLQQRLLTLKYKLGQKSN